MFAFLFYRCYTTSQYPGEFIRKDTLRGGVMGWAAVQRAPGAIRLWAETRQRDLLPNLGGTETQAGYFVGWE